MFAIRKKTQFFRKFLLVEATVLTLAKKYRNSFDWVFEDLSNATFCKSLRRSGAELDGGGGGVKPPCYNRSSGPARVNIDPMGIAWKK